MTPIWCRAPRSRALGELSLLIVAARLTLAWAFALADGAAPTDSGLFCRPCADAAAAAASGGDAAAGGAAGATLADLRTFAVRLDG